MHELEYIDCYGNKLDGIWLESYIGYDIEFDIEFEERIKKLKILHRWFKGILLSKRLKKLIPMLIPLYYRQACHSNAKGGYIHKRDMLKFFNDIVDDKII